MDYERISTEHILDSSKAKHYHIEIVYRLNENLPSEVSDIIEYLHDLELLTQVDKAATVALTSRESVYVSSQVIRIECADLSDSNKYIEIVKRVTDFLEQRQCTVISSVIKQVNDTIISAYYIDKDITRERSQLVKSTYEIDLTKIHGKPDYYLPITIHLIRAFIDGLNAPGIARYKLGIKVVPSAVESKIHLIILGRELSATYRRGMIGHLLKSVSQAESIRDLLDEIIATEQVKILPHGIIPYKGIDVD